MKKNLTAAVLVLAVLCSVTFTGCSSRSSSASVTEKSAAGASAAKSVAGAMKNEVAADAAAPKAAAPQAPQAAVVPESQRKIVKNAQLTVETMQYDKSARDFEAMVAQYGGYIANSGIQTGSEGSARRRTATYTVRIPADSLDPFLTATDGIGSVTEKNIQGDDVTQAYIDADAQLKTLQTEQDRILALMDKATKIEDVIAIEQRLTEVQNQIAQLTAELKNWDSLVSLSTVDVTIREVEAISNPEGRGLGYQLGSTLSASLRALVETGRYILVAVIAILPFAVIILIVLAVIFWIRRRRKRNP
jgi:hypothetical protein